MIETHSAPATLSAELIDLIEEQAVRIRATPAGARWLAYESAKRSIDRCSEDSDQYTLAMKQLADSARL